jgi:hypothetical protein
MVQVNVKIEGVREAVKNLRRFKGRIKDWSPVATGVQAYLLTRMETRFNTVNTSEGQRWPGYYAEPAYAQWKQAIVGHNQILRWEIGGPYSMLFESITEAQDPYHVWEARDMTLKFGTSVPHAPDLLQNTIGPFGEPSPARDFITLGQESRNHVVKIITDWVLGGIKP